MTKRLLSIFNKKEKINSQDDPFLSFININGRTILTVEKKPSFVDRIIFPAIDESDPWQVTALSIFINKLTEENQAAYFSICTLNDFLEALKIPMTNETLVCYKKLKSIHCIKYDIMHPEVVRSIPGLITCVITSGVVNEQYQHTKEEEPKTNLFDGETQECL